MERPPATLSAADRVLLVRLGAVGDVLRALPAVRRVRVAFPGLSLSWIVEDLSRPLLEDHPDVDAVIPFPRREMRAIGRPATPLAAVRALKRRLREGDFTACIDLQSSFKSGATTLLSGAPRRIGFAPGHCRELSFLFSNEWVPLSSPWLNRVDRNLEMAAALGACSGAADAVLPERPAEGRAATALLEDLVPGGGPAVVFSPGVSRRQSWKAWPGGHYGRLARLLHRSRGIRPIVVWGPGEEELARTIARTAGPSVVLAPPTGLRLLAALLRRSTVFVGADTGPMHLAWVTGCRVVALFGPTDPRLNAPRGDGHRVLCSADGTMASLLPEAVHEIVVRTLASATPARPSMAPEVAT
jgi:lipopolysaccharide heptosyltransferase I